MQVEEYFRGKGCIVTGAASGIGYAVTEALLQAGAAVLLADRNEKMLAAALEQLSAHSGRIHSMAVDVSSEHQVQEMIEGGALRLGRLDILFNNAGIGGMMPVKSATLEQWRRIIDINLWGVIYGIHFALPVMGAQGGGHIVTTSSIAGLVPSPYQALYCTTKYAIVGLSETLRFELEEEGIDFSVICPGNVATRIFGTPIIGEPIDAAPPADAVSAGDAAKTILAGVANKEGIIVLPEKYCQFWTQYCHSPEKIEPLLRDLARERRESRPWERPH